MKKCIVTGGLGFIGSNLVDILISKGHSVTVIDDLSTGNINYKNQDARYEIFSLLDLQKTTNLFEEIKPNWIFHLAAWPRIQPSFDHPIEHDDVNVRACINLVNACANIQIEALVYSSSSSVYGDPEIYPTNEDAKINPLSPYALQKFTGERYLHIIGDFKKIPVVSLRYFNAYGVRSYNPSNKLNAYSSVVGIFNNNLKNGSEICITGDGTQRRDFVHVYDIASANIIVAENIEKAKTKVFNVGTGRAITILELASFFSSKSRFIDSRYGEALITHADPTKLKKLGWRPMVTVEYAIEKGIV